MAGVWGVQAVGEELAAWFGRAGSVKIVVSRLSGVVMSNFLDDNLNQSVFFDTNYLEVLSDNTFDYCLYHLLEREELISDFLARYKNHNAGRKAYPPALLRRTIFYAYHRGHISHRVIPKHSKTDPKF
ncbi:MAG: hypothetical protein GY822_32630, partial [Deltaproteobacteria bacterium]|nr:hypothetical protein [Deltaproteobacteria bacterium]